MTIKKMMPLGSLVVGIALLATGCMTSQTPSRKKMPNYLESGYLEATNPFNTKIDRLQTLSLVATNELVMVEDRSVSCVAVPLNSAAYDEPIFSLVQEYKPLAVMLLTNWVAMGHNGAVLDLRSNPSQSAIQAQYFLEKQGAFSLPVILKWDKASEPRAFAYMSLLNDVPGVSVKKLK